MTVLIRPAAAADIENAFIWYEGQHPGLGTEFLDVVRKALDAIQANPQAHPAIYRSTRRALLRRFPYGIYYRVYPDAIVVVACMHGRRDPKVWQWRA